MPKPPTKAEIALRASQAAAAKRQAQKDAKRTASGPLASIGDYDEALGRPVTWGDAKKREEVRGELTLNEARVEDLNSKRIDNKAKRDAWVTKTEAEHMATKIRESWWREAQKIGPMALLKLSDIPSEIRARVKDAVIAEAHAAAERVASEMLQ